MAAPTNMRKLSARSAKEENIPLASMMDIFTNMLLFLIMSYSATGLLVNQVDQLELPQSNIDTSPRSTVSIVVDSGQLSGTPGVYAEDKGKRVQLLDEGSTLLAVASGAAAQDPAAMTLPGLQQYLRGVAVELRVREQQLGIPFDGQITIQADAAVDYNSILKVLKTCGDEQFAMTQFVVIKSE
ncbi:MAG: biopolymer transporter ExbD [Candidatus Delongbacteria bacterium]